MAGFLSWLAKICSCGYADYDPEADVIGRGSEQCGDYYINWKQTKHKVTFEAYHIASGVRTIKMGFRVKDAAHNAPTGTGPLVVLINRFIEIFNQLRGQ